MADRYDRSVRVSQAVIDEIKKKGMKAAIDHANSGKATLEEREGAKRMYGSKVSAPSTWSESDTANNGKASPSVKPSTSKPASTPTASPKTEPISSTKPAPPSSNVQKSADRRLQQLQAKSDAASASYKAKGRGSGREGKMNSARSAVEKYTASKPKNDAAAKAEGAERSANKTASVKNLQASFDKAHRDFKAKGTGSGREGKVRAARRKLDAAKKGKGSRNDSLSDSSSFM